MDYSVIVPIWCTEEEDAGGDEEELYSLVAWIYTACSTQPGYTYNVSHLKTDSLVH